MSISELFGTAGVIENDVAELLACQIENTIADCVETVIVSVAKRNAVHLAARLKKRQL